MALQTLKSRALVVAIICGVLLSLATGIIENQPGIGIPEYTHYGYPLVWRVTKTFEPTEYKFGPLAIDAAFWIIIALLAMIIVETLRLKLGFRYETLVLLLVLFVPLGLVMDFVHECGHAMWGTAAGGRLAYMQIAFFEIYPRLAITPHFRLGYAQVEGLTTKFASGLMSLGGSLTTNIVSWLLALILMRTSLRYKTRVALKVLGLFGLVDLPFYVLFPQIGLGHWIFLGGRIPEPLVGARNMGIPDAAFYLVVALTTLGLVFLYFKPFLEKAWKTIEAFLGVVRSRRMGNLGIEKGT